MKMIISEETRIRFRSALRNLSSTIYNLLGYSERNIDAEDLRQLKNLALNLPDRVYSLYKEEVDYLAQIPACETPIFPYPEVKARSTCSTGRENGLPYVLHKGKKLFFPISTTEDEARISYLNYIDYEGLTGQGMLRKSPLSYVGANFKPEKGDVLIDIGSAEAVFSLDYIDDVSQVYIFEALEKWTKPLSQTFAPYKDKVLIITKLVSSRTSGNLIRLDEAIPTRQSSTYFIKMDIEGSEFDVLTASESFLRTNKIKLACCTYHRQDDAKNISNYLTKLGFKISFTDGYMLPPHNGIRFPYFRKAMIHAVNF